MEVQQTSETPSSQDSSTQAVSQPNTESTAPAIQTSQTPSSNSTDASTAIPGVNAEPGAPVIPQVPTFQPNFKFNVMKKDYEVPEQFRQLIKDADTEKQVKEIFEKAYGLDHVKAERSKVSEEYKTYKGQTEPIMKVAQQLEHHRQRGDLGSYFKTLGLTKEEIFKWTINQAEIEELPDHQRRAYDQQQELAQRAYMLEQQLQEREEQFTQIQVQTRQSELQNALSQPTVASFVEAFDQRNGEGSFRNEVVARGQMYWHTQQVDIPPERLVGEIMNRYGLNQMQPQVSQPQLQTQAPNLSASKAPNQVPVIPNTGSGSSSPAQRTIKSLDDINKVYQEKFGN